MGKWKHGDDHDGETVVHMIPEFVTSFALSNSQTGRGQRELPYLTGKEPPANANGPGGSPFYMELEAFS